MNKMDERILKEPLNIEKTYYGYSGNCPECCIVVKDDEDFCKSCGQRLDWDSVKIDVGCDVCNEYRYLRRVERGQDYISAKIRGGEEFNLFVECNIENKYKMMSIDVKYCPICGRILK